MITTPRLETAYADRRVRGSPLSVYLYLCNKLNPVTFEAVYAESVAIAVRIKPITAAWALRRLVEDGYLERKAGKGRTRSYRLAWNGKTKKAS